MNKKFLLKTILALQIIQGINTVANNQTTMERYESITYRLLSIELDLHLWTFKTLGFTIPN